MQGLHITYCTALFNTICSNFSPTASVVYAYTTVFVWSVQPCSTETLEGAKRALELSRHYLRLWLEVVTASRWPCSDGVNISLHFFCLFL